MLADNPVCTLKVSSTTPVQMSVRRPCLNSCLTSRFISVAVLMFNRMSVSTAEALEKARERTVS